MSRPPFTVNDLPSALAESERLMFFKGDRTTMTLVTDKEISETRAEELSRSIGGRPNIILQTVMSQVPAVRQAFDMILNNRPPAWIQEGRQL